MNYEGHSKTQTAPVIRGNWLGDVGKCLGCKSVTSENKYLGEFSGNTWRIRDSSNERGNDLTRKSSRLVSSVRGRICGRVHSPTRSLQPPPSPEWLWLDVCCLECWPHRKIIFNIKHAFWLHSSCIVYLATRRENRVKVNTLTIVYMHTNNTHVVQECFSVKLG